MYPNINTPFFITVLHKYITNQKITPNKVTEVVTSQISLLHNKEYILYSTVLYYNII